MNYKRMKIRMSKQNVFILFIHIYILCISVIHDVKDNFLSLVHIRLEIIRVVQVHKQMTTWSLLTLSDKKFWAFFRKLIHCLAEAQLQIKNNTQHIKYKSGKNRRKLVHTADKITLGSFARNSPSLSNRVKASITCNITNISLVS